MEVVISESAILEAIGFISSDAFAGQVRSFRRAHAHLFDTARPSPPGCRGDADRDQDEKSGGMYEETKKVNFHDLMVAESKVSGSRDAKYTDDEKYGAVRHTSYESVTHTVEMTTAFQEYTNLLEGLLEDFLAKRGVSVSAFLSECSDAVEGKFTPLFGEHEHLWFVELLQTWSSYTAFYEIMAAEAKLARK
jgi:hypothetical protein